MHCRPLISPWAPPTTIPRYLLPGEQDVGQVLANLCGSVETHPPGVVDDVGDSEEGGRPGEGSCNAWGDEL